MAVTGPVADLLLVAGADTHADTITSQSSTG